MQFYGSVWHFFSGIFSRLILFFTVISHVQSCLFAWHFGSVFIIQESRTINFNVADVRIRLMCLHSRSSVSQPKPKGWFHASFSSEIHSATHPETNFFFEGFFSNPPCLQVENRCSTVLLLSSIILDPICELHVHVCFGAFVMLFSFLCVMQLNGSRRDST